MVMLWKAVKWFKQKFVTSEDPVISCNINNRGELTNINGNINTSSEEEVNESISEPNDNIDDVVRIFDTLKETVLSNEYSTDESVDASEFCKQVMDALLQDVIPNHSQETNRSSSSNNQNDVCSKTNQEILGATSKITDETYERELMTVELPECVKWIQDIIDERKDTDGIYELHCNSHFDEYANTKPDCIESILFDIWGNRRYVMSCKSKRSKYTLINLLDYSYDRQFIVYTGTLSYIRKLLLINDQYFYKYSCFVLTKHQTNVFMKNITTVIDDEHPDRCVFIRDDEIEYTSDSYEPEFKINLDYQYSIIYKLDNILHMKRNTSFDVLMSYINDHKIVNNYVIWYQKIASNYSGIISYNNLTFNMLKLERKIFMINKIAVHYINNNKE